MPRKTLTQITILILSCVLMVVIPAGNAYPGVFSKSVARVAARKAAHRAAAKSIGRKTSGKIAARKVAHKSVKKIAPKKDWKKIYARDLKRDRNTVAEPLEKGRKVRRYTSMKDARAARKNGISAGTHMTARIPKGRPVSARTAQQRYGIRKKPTARMTILLPKGHPVKKNKSIGGRYGEITAKKLQGNSVLRIDRIH